MTPYFQARGITLYHGDCRDVLPALAQVDAVVTDPVWPNATPRIVGHDRPAALLAEVMALLPDRANRVVVQMGRGSDPRVLAAVPEAFPFLAVCWLEYARPSYAGRMLNSADVAYAFGEWPASRVGQRVVPGKFMATDQPEPTAHPCPRRRAHVRWLVDKWAEGAVLDPFCGSGTTLLAARDCGFPAVGIEIDERWCEEAARRLDQPTMNLFAREGAA